MMAEPMMDDPTMADPTMVPAQIPVLPTTSLPMRLKRLVSLKETPVKSATKGNPMAREPIVTTFVATAAGAGVGEAALAASAPIMAVTSRSPKAT
jgi:hypothetical protein